MVVGHCCKRGELWWAIVTMDVACWWANFTIGMGDPCWWVVFGMDGWQWWWAIVSVDVVWWGAVFTIGMSGLCWWVTVAMDGWSDWLLLPFMGDIGEPWLPVWDLCVHWFIISGVLWWAVDAV